MSAVAYKPHCKLCSEHATVEIAQQSQPVEIKSNSCTQTVVHQMLHDHACLSFKTSTTMRQTGRVPVQRGKAAHVFDTKHIQRTTSQTEDTNLFLFSYLATSCSSMILAVCGGCKRSHCINDSQRDSSVRLERAGLYVLQHGNCLGAL